VHRDDNIATFICQLPRNSGSLNLLEPYVPVSACIRIAFTSAEGYCLLRHDTMSPVKSLPSCWRNGCIHIQGTRLRCVEENCRITTHSLPASSLFQACPLHSFLLSSYILPPITFFFCPPFLSSPLFLYYNNHAMQTLTPTPVLPSTHPPTHPFQAAFSCCVLHNPWLCNPLPDIPHPSSSHRIFFCHGERGRKFGQNGSKVFASFYIHTHSPFVISFNIVMFSVQILL